MNPTWGLLYASFNKHLLVWNRLSYNLFPDSSVTLADDIDALLGRRQSTAVEGESGYLIGFRLHRPDACEEWFILFWYRKDILVSYLVDVRRLTLTEFFHQIIGDKQIHPVPAAFIYHVNQIIIRELWHLWGIDIELTQPWKISDGTWSYGLDSLANDKLLHAAVFEGTWFNSLYALGYNKNVKVWKDCIVYGQNCD